jgi:hypothetical protein
MMEEWERQIENSKCALFSRRRRRRIFTFDTADVIVELLLEFVGRILLLVEILDVIVEYFVGCSVHFAHLLQDLNKTGIKKRWFN